MENVGLYISDLLSEHDCVIVPGFGGFVARPAQAHFSKAGNMLLPPGKSLVFNKNLDNSDGLLANYLSQKNKISYREASTLIEQWVFNSKRQLDAQKRLELEKTGILYFDSENTLLFEPAASSTHQVSSFGLVPVKATKLAKEEEIKTIDTKNYRLAEAKTPSRTLARISVIVSSVLLFLFLILLTAKQLPISGALASLNPLAAKEEGYAVKTYNFNKLFSAAPPKALPVVKGGITLKVSENTKTFVVSADTVSLDKTTVIRSSHSFSGNAGYNGPFQIVVGCFAIEQNAHKLIGQLQKDHIPAGISGRNPRGLYVVSLAGFTSESLARVKLEQVKQRFPAAWILVK